jgi:hypothetical protein
MTCNCKTKYKPSRCGAADGEVRKAEAIALLADRRAVYVRQGQRALLKALLAAGTATADDVRNSLNLPPGIDPVCLGAVPSALARAGITCRDGFVPTCRPMAHARPLSVWRLADRAAALHWLADHPDLPDPDQSDEVAASQRLLFPTNTTNEPGATAATAAPGMEF